MEKVQEDQTKTVTALAPVELDEEWSLAERAEKSLIERLQRMQDAALVFERRTQLIETCHLVAIRRTRPQDWVLFRDRQANEIAMVTASGAQLVAEVYGVVIQNVRPIDERGMFAPEVVTYPNGSFAYRASCDAWSRVNGRSIEALEIARRSDEEFTGRGVTKNGDLTVKPGERTGALDSDLRSSVLTGLQTKAVRVLCGMSRVPIADLDRAWKDTPKKVSECRKGSGYGTSTERSAATVADTDVPAEAKKLGEEILKRVAGDKSAAADLLREITAGKDFKGFDSVARFTQAWQLENAWKKLREHATFGDAAQRESGQEG